MEENLAVALQRFGGPEVLEVMQRPRPVPRPGEVVVRVGWAPINPTDLLFRAGAQADRMTGLEPPYIPGMELAGAVVDLADVPDASFSRGARVAGIVNPRRPTGGAQARFVRVPWESVVPIPEDVDAPAAATLTMNGLTALLAVEALDLPRGAAVLVTGGAGVVGGFAIGIAGHAGLTVLADGYEVDAERLRQLGAAVVLPRGVALSEALHTVCPSGVDGIIDAAGLGQDVQHLVRDGGVAVSLRGKSQSTHHRFRSHLVSVTDHSRRQDKLRLLMSLASAGVVQPKVARTITWSEVPDAHRAMERGGVRGRLVLATV